MRGSQYDSWGEKKGRKQEYVLEKDSHGKKSLQKQTASRRLDGVNPGDTSMESNMKGPPERCKLAAARSV